MILTRTPLRISIGGGGTDLPSYFRHSTGRLISAAIDKYIYVAVNRTFTNDYVLKYSSEERVGSIDEIQHPLIRETLRAYDVGPGIEIVSVADIPAGTGLGSSGTFTVGLLRALHAFRHQHLSTHALAEAACHIEIDLLGESVGKQDQYIAAYGGMTRFEFRPDGTVDADRLAISTDAMDDLEEHLLLFFTGYSRSATNILSEQRMRSEQGDEVMLANLDEVRDLGDSIGAALLAGDTAKFATLMHEHWERKRTRTGGISRPEIDAWYELGRANGALGGKLVGAGAGGFLMFYADDTRRLRRAFASEGLPEVKFGFDHDGSIVLARS